MSSTEPSTATGEGRPEARVLVVDDDEQMRRLLSRLVAAEGLECVVAGTVAEAREKIAASQPALVLLDVHLPGESGLSLARELAHDPDGPAVVMVSGQDDVEVADIALRSGAYGYLTKPFKAGEVAIAVNDALRRRRREQEERLSRVALEDRVVQRGAELRTALADLRHAQEETVLRLSKAIEYRDPESGRHIQRMSRYCGLLAAHFDLDAEVVEVASRLHDVGKIAVPDSILQKPGPLTPDERAQMERHAEIGHRLLRGSGNELLDVAATIAWTHHERFDGGGYPRALAGDAIPLVGRIAAVADVFDALITSRPHRPARSVDEALASVTGGRGAEFDPAVVDAFVARLEDIVGIIARYDEPLAEPVAEAPDGTPTMVMLQDAAAAVGVSASTLRRWADEGRVRAVRTAGGHRRFPLDAIRRLTAEHSGRGVVRPVAPPSEPLPEVAAILRGRGSELTAAAASALYRGGGPGWFVGDDGAAALAEWVEELAAGSERGRFEAVLEATDALMRRAALQGASLLERHRFLERYGDVVVRTLSHGESSQAERAATRRLFAALQQAQLDDRS
jgi:excisionase family DNA binding protein